MTPGRLEVGLVGTAPELAIIGLALAGAGHFPWTITEPAPADRERVVSLLRGVSIQSPAEVVAATQLVIIGAGEGETVAEIVESLIDSWRPGQIVLHTSAEHGVGQLKLDGLRSHKGEVAHDLMRALKRALDPQNTLNPHKVVSI